MTCRISGPPVLTRAEAARVLGVHRSTVGYDQPGTVGSDHHASLLRIGAARQLTGAGTIAAVAALRTVAARWRRRGCGGGRQGSWERGGVRRFRVSCPVLSPLPPHAV